MDPVAFIAAVIGAQAGRVQLAVAGDMLKMDGANEQSAVKLIDAAELNLNRLANVAAGIGGNLDVSV